MRRWKMSEKVDDVIKRVLGTIRGMEQASIVETRQASVDAITSMVTAIEMKMNFFAEAKDILLLFKERCRSANLEQLEEIMKAVQAMAIIVYPSKR
jgi:hypothetical protein